MLFYFLGIDQSLQHTGLAIVNSNGAIEKTAALIVAGKLSGAERLFRIVQDFRGFLHGTLITAAAIEGYSVESTNRPFDLGEVSGAFRAEYYSLFRHELLVVPPTSLKKYVTGASGAEKELMVSTVKTRWGLESDDDNIADAVGLAQMARSTHLGEFSTRTQREAVTKLTRPKRVKIRHHGSKDNV